jgi:hypothetical protein
VAKKKDGGAGAADAQPSPQEVILGMALSYLVSRSLHVANDLGVADLLKDGPRDIEELARATGTHQLSLYRLLRMLAAHGVFAEGEPGRFRLTPAAAVIQSDVPGSLHDAVSMVGDLAGDGSWWNAVGFLRHSVTTGEPGFDYIKGVGFFDFLGQHPEAGKWFDRGLASFATPENAAIVSAYDFAPFPRIVDVGGGRGGLLAEILKAHPTARGTLYDRAEVVEEPTYLANAGLIERCEVVGGDFFTSVPRGGDAYILKRILHDWGDGRCVQILRTCREAMGPETRVLAVDAVIPPGNGPHPGKVMDILMMALVEGRERTAEEFRELFREAGLRLTRVIATASVLSIIEGERA